MRERVVREKIFEANIRSAELRVINSPFLSSPGPLYQDEAKCSAFDMEIILHSYANETHFHKKDCALGLNLKVRVFRIQRWPIVLVVY